MVFLYQLNKPNGELDITDFIPLIMSTITLQPSPRHRYSWKEIYLIHRVNIRQKLRVFFVICCRNSPQFNKEVFVDFMGAQIKALSFLAYIIRLYQGIVATHSQLMVKGMLGLLALCPNEVAHLRRELLIAARHILATDLRSSKYFVSVLSVYNIRTMSHSVLTPINSSIWKIFNLSTLILNPYFIHIKYVCKV